jgi:hypothetical protein
LDCIHSSNSAISRYFRSFESVSAEEASVVLLWLEKPAEDLIAINSENSLDERLNCHNCTSGAMLC